MMKNNSIKTALYICLLFSATKENAFLPINLIGGFDPNLIPIKKPNEKVQISFLGTTIFEIKAQNASGTRVNPLHRLHETQNSLAMLKGFAMETEQAQLGQLINIDNDNGIRGHFVTTANFKLPFCNYLIGRYYFNHGLWFGAELPIISAKVESVEWKDLTENKTLDDALTHQYVTDNLFQTVARLGQGLNLSDWENIGLGDFVTYMGWKGTFPQEKEWLKQVNVDLWVGVSSPTGYRKNPHHAFSFDFGTGGAFAILFGTDLTLCFREFFMVGVDLNFFKPFSHTITDRVRTNVAQTDLLLLKTARVRRQLGFIQKFNLFFEPKIYKNFFIRFAYEHIKESPTKIHVLSEDFNNEIANFGMDTDIRTLNDFIMQIKLIFDKGQFVIFGKQTISGKRSFKAPLFGVQLTLDF